LRFFRAGVHARHDKSQNIIRFPNSGFLHFPISGEKNSSGLVGIRKQAKRVVNLSMLQVVVAPITGIPDILHVIELMNQGIWKSGVE